MVTGEQLKFNDEITLKQLRDVAIEVSERRCVNSIGKMFSIEIKFASDCLLKWFYSKHKKLELSINEKKNLKPKIQ